MSKIEEDIRKVITTNTAVAAIISTRMYIVAPIRPLDGNPYAIFNRDSKTRDMVSEKNVFTIVAFAQDFQVLLTLAEKIILALEGKKSLNGNKYYSNSLISQRDGSQKLEDGYFWSTLTFEFKATI